MLYKNQYYVIYITVDIFCKLVYMNISMHLIENRKQGSLFVPLFIARQWCHIVH